MQLDYISFGSYMYMYCVSLINNQINCVHNFMMYTIYLSPNTDIHCITGLNKQYIVQSIKQSSWARLFKTRLFCFRNFVSRFSVYIAWPFVSLNNLKLHTT